MCHSSGAERALSFASDAQNGTLGKKSVHSYITEAFGDEKAAVSFRAKQVSFKFYLCYVNEWRSRRCTHILVH